MPMQPTLQNQDTQRQLLIYFKNEQDKKYIEETILKAHDGEEVDFCRYERNIHLWEFPNAKTANKVKILTDTQSTQRKLDVDIDINKMSNISKDFEENENPLDDKHYDINYERLITIYMLDTGAIDEDSPEDDAYFMEEVPIYQCKKTTPGKGYNYLNPAKVSGNFTDDNGHGTFGFRLITQGLPSGENTGIKVVPLKVFNKNGKGTLFSLVCALYHAIDNNANIINISAGYKGKASVVLENAIKEAKAKGIFIVTAAGNDSRNIDTKPHQFPAYYAKDYDNVISVACADKNGKLHKESNYGTESVTIVAEGEEIGGYNHKGNRIKATGTSISAFKVTRELAIEMAQRSEYKAIWNDFKKSSLLDIPIDEGQCKRTKTGKKLLIKPRDIKTRESLVNEPRIIKKFAKTKSNQQSDKIDA